MKVKIEILASDFKDNSFYNMEDGLEGCPIERAGINKLDNLAYSIAHNTKIGDDYVGNIVSNMFENKNPKDFTFEIDMP